MSFLLLTGGHDSPLADTFPDPAGRDFPGPAVLFRFGQRVRGRGGVVVRHEVSVVRHKVPPQPVKVLHGDRQEKLHAAEDVQQRLQDKHKQSAEETHASVLKCCSSWMRWNHASLFISINSAVTAVWQQQTKTRRLLTVMKMHLAWLTLQLLKFINLSEKWVLTGFYFTRWPSVLLDLTAKVTAEIVKCCIMTKHKSDGAQSFMKTKTAQNITHNTLSLYNQFHLWPAHTHNVPVKIFHNVVKQLFCLWHYCFLPCTILSDVTTSQLSVINRTDARAATISSKL